MRSFSKLGLALLLVFPLSSILCLAVTLVYSIRRRRRRRQTQSRLAGDAELGCKGATFKAVSVLNALCCKTQSRVEPAMGSPVLCSTGSLRVKIHAAADEEKKECVPAMWVSAAMGPSRLLYTIKEEEREGLEVEEKEEDDYDFFTTPCDSPEFYTPASSPAREAEKEADVAVWLSPAAKSGFGIS